jgi:hypothetical protein
LRNFNRNSRHQEAVTIIVKNLAFLHHRGQKLHGSKGSSGRGTARMVCPIVWRAAGTRHKSSDSIESIDRFLVTRFDSTKRFSPSEAQPCLMQKVVQVRMGLESSRKAHFRSEPPQLLQLSSTPRFCSPAAQKASNC